MCLGTARVIVEQTGYISVVRGGDGCGASEVQGPRVLIDYVMSTNLANLNNGL